MSLGRFECGPFLDHCTCVGAFALTPSAMQARHEASVRRAKRSDAGMAAPAQSGNMRGRQASALRVQQRSAADGSTLLELLRRAS